MRGIKAKALRKISNYHGEESGFRMAKVKREVFDTKTGLSGKEMRYKKREAKFQRVLDSSAPRKRYRIFKRLYRDGHITLVKSHATSKK